MDTSTHNEPKVEKQIAPEFASWPMSDGQFNNANTVRGEFDRLQSMITNMIPPTNGRYLALVKTKLEEACMLAVKGIAKP